MTEYHLSVEKTHVIWSKQIKPLLVIDPGDIVTFEILDGSGGQIKQNSTIEDLKKEDYERINPLTGPIYIENSEPGDVLKIEILSIKDKGWGWSGFFPSYGLLAEDFPYYYLRIFKVKEKMINFSKNIKIPIKPFCGVMGTCPNRSIKAIDTVSAGEFGGNMDVKHLTEKTILYLPVFVKGALFSVGDGHLLQGDGEICWTALEAPLSVKLKFDVEKKIKRPVPSFEIKKARKKTSENEAAFVTIGFGNSLEQASKMAIRSMINYLESNYSLSREDAYLLCSLIVDLKIASVNPYSYTATAFLPRNSLLP
ncbi:MAG: acetamidase/formamidase family protein [Candidatus Hadarchaeum sp.]